MVVEVTHKCNMASYFLEVGNLNGRNADMCHVLGPRVAARGICFRFQMGQILRTVTISPITITTGRHLGFERDYNYHTAFRARYVIMFMHKVARARFPALCVRGYV